MPHSQMIIRMIASNLNLAPRLNLANQTAKPPLPSRSIFRFETERDCQGLELAWGKSVKVGWCARGEAAPEGGGNCGRLMAGAGPETGPEDGRTPRLGLADFCLGWGLEAETGACGRDGCFLAF